MAIGPIRFTNALAGTADFTYPGPAIDMQSPTSAGAVDGTTYQYYAQSLDMTQWEIGLGAYTASTGVFARTTVEFNSLGTTAKINFFNPPEVAFYEVFPAVPLPATALPLVDGTAAVGTSLKYAREDHVHPATSGNAPLNSPNFTGTPTAPTAAVDTNTTQLATTAFVLAQASSTSPAMDGSAAVGTSTHFARADHVHPTDTSRAPLASPGLTGTPTAPTAAAGTNTTQIATTAFVLANGITHTAGGVGSFAVGSAATGSVPLNTSGLTYPGTWQLVSNNTTADVMLFQRIA